MNSHQRRKDGRRRRALVRDILAHRVNADDMYKAVGQLRMSDLSKLCVEKITLEPKFINGQDL